MLLNLYTTTYEYDKDSQKKSRQLLRQQVVQNYFGKDAMKYRMVRIPIDSCDFSLGHYEADSDPEDTEFAKFSFERVEKYILPLLDAAEAAYGGKLDIIHRGALRLR